MSSFTSFHPPDTFDHPLNDAPLGTFPQTPHGPNPSPPATDPRNEGTPVGADNHQFNNTAPVSFFVPNPAPLEGPQTAADTANSTGVASDYGLSLPAARSDLDVAGSIPRLYRVLDLIHERGSGGLVDKIIIEQDSLGRLINDLRPHAYTSITKVDFSALDQVDVKPIGLYGSKPAIVDWLRKKGFVDAETASAMLRPTDMAGGHTRPVLRSGMYVLRIEDEDTIYVIYWPEDATWDDGCSSAVRRNRITFMRYLTKITDQVVCLLSDEHANAIVWRKDESDSDDESLEDEETDRLFAFEVSKTNEQEEGVTARDGFELRLPQLTVAPHAEHAGIDPDVLRSRLVRGETQQGLLVPVYAPAQRRSRQPVDTLSDWNLREKLKRKSIVLGESLSAEGLDVLLQCGLRHSNQNAVAEYQTAVAKVKEDSRVWTTKQLDRMLAVVDGDIPSLSSFLRKYLTEQVLLKFPQLGREELQRSNITPAVDPKDVPLPLDDDHVTKLCELYPDVNRALKKAPQAQKLNLVNSDKYKDIKRRILTLDFLLNTQESLSEEQRQDLVETVLQHGHTKSSPVRQGGWLRETSRKLTEFLTGSDITSGGSSSSPQTVDVPQNVLEVDDSVFLSQLHDIADRHPLLTEPATLAINLAQTHFRENIKKEAKDLSQTIRRIQRDFCREQIHRNADIEVKKQLEQLRVEILAMLNASMRPANTAARELVTIHRVEIATTQSAYYLSKPSYEVFSTEETYTDPEIRYTLYPVELTSGDVQRMKEDPSHVPKPQILQNSSSSFSLPIGTTIVYVHLLPKNRCMLITRDRSGEGKVYVSALTHLQGAISRRASFKDLKRDKVGEHLLLAYDESKRILAVLGMSMRDTRSLELHTFVMDGGYTALQGMGIPAKLTGWYDPSVTITHMEFKTGSEELLFVDDSGRARIFSLVTQLFRPAVLQLKSSALAVHATPDGSCFFAIDQPAEDSDTTVLRAFHWSSFGSSSDGIEIGIPTAMFKEHIVTSFLTSSNVYLLGLHTHDNVLCSVAFKITRKVTEFTFKEKGGTAMTRQQDTTAHNSIIDCLADVWTRFPVVPAVRRETILSACHERRALLFVSNINHSPFENHFVALVNEFERLTRKPVGDELSSIRIFSLNHQDFLRGQPFTPSTFRAGEWLVELLCLIPIHIAVTRDNRFIPLKDGIWSAAHEKSLLGADVAGIVESITVGWYESIFQSYMAMKPVKVVSSMGEQSVGKSFALNHLVDTSFAGSAMRTTEGVWMSVTPTTDALIVALDFEGVHSIERSAQEDTLLVLFNTAISNLVLFRNNFALSRDITGLFQSFQSSASVLDPEANPMLFQSTLVIIIKDVIDSDKTEIKREFQHKFQEIVQAEQAMNFISRLHHNRLDIIPWPVIESKEFYKLFRTVKKRLDQQPLTHAGGVVFLQTMKTLMAKLKVNDWGAMSQNLAVLRVHLLLSLLPKAVVFGAAEVHPDFEPLKDFDSATVIEVDDSTIRLFIAEEGPAGQAASQEDAIREMCLAWPDNSQRLSQQEADWKKHLQDHLDHIVDTRVEHVRVWLNANTSKFGPTHAEVQQLYRKFDAIVIDLKTSVRLCGAQCTDCQLSCLFGRHHEGIHRCQTDHRCIYHCQFEGANHDDSVPCGLPAGHPGSHLCDVTAHLCGRSCKLKGKKGCQGECVKMVDHEGDEHLCSATTHECGMACSLHDVRLNSGRRFSCSGSCRIPSDEPHHEHRCNNSQCPIECELCKRLCSEHDHLHGLDPAAIHICGQEHACSALCGAHGICQIETSPQSVEATFTGRHESFQYTKYTQVSKRLQCIVMIPAGETSHPGNHAHDLSATPFHFCEERCPDCGYFCMLPLGHTQQEHDTSHGSMSRTKWSVEGPDGTVLEVNGRKFGTNDDGAPMLCSMYCRSMGRHAHLSWCRADNPRTCGGPELEHISTAVQPEPNKPKDWISHSLYWQRTGFKDPYSQEDRAEFAKCDRMCSGPEHNAATHQGAQSSYCTLPILHPRQPLDQAVPGGLGYISNDGHSFMCRNPAVLRQAFHVIFAIDRSGSMTGNDRRPLDYTPTTQIIRRSHNNRLGAVYSSLQGFWEARHRAVVAGGNAAVVRRDAYTVILFNHGVTTAINHDFNSAPVDLLNIVLRHNASGGTDFTYAIQTAKAAMENHWSPERTPVVIFLSDGECSIADETMQDLCRRSIARGKPLSFHAVAFGPSAGNLRRMAQIARDVERGAPQDPLNPHAGVPSAYHEALDTVRLAETFLGIADSLAKPRGSLFRG